ncbi:putative outer membrane protein pmp21 [Chlamydia avium]|uniref:Autotransporter beta-domain protein n=1 Tax=Chlamydia avium TaxID=1457141 RepID=A0ABN0MTV4_9CHLA|nr:autotransporter domain-containing protein [Chlamydia avium]EPP36973.1 autotransporter beta-domain protein [Chlamydia psittaci 10_743_SC13]EPP38907.1 autotransporter beta-domain protein [Chlamydia avium]VVT43033.1 putative outer membrane protein pmp21 [Chlamydia avium]
MVANKVSRFQSAFSRSIVVTILASIRGLYGYELDSQQTLSESFSWRQIQSEFISTGILKRDKPIEFKQENRVCGDKSVLNNLSSYVPYVLSFAEVAQGQFFTDKSHFFHVGELFLWTNIDASSDNSSSSIVVPLKQDSEETKVLSNYALKDANHGLAFCYKSSSNGDADEQGNLGFIGLAFLGTGGRTGLSFSSLKSREDGAAIYSDKDVIFENLREKLVFNECETQTNGGGVGAQSIVVNNCSDVSLTYCKSQLDLLSSHQETDLSRGGGAIHASCSQGTYLKSSFPNGSIILSNNDGVVLIEGNHADKANGGALACSHFTCSANHKDIFCLKNQALSGGVISSEQVIDIYGNVGFLEFTENAALISTSTGTSTLLGGGVLASGEEINLCNNSRLHCCKNSSQSYGGAFVSKNIKIVENVGDFLFKSNSANLSGGAISSQNMVEIQNNFGSLIFEKNEAQYGGGAVHCYASVTSQESSETSQQYGEIKILNNSGDVSFISNTNKLDAATVPNYMGGGALYGDSIVVAGNRGSVAFSKNSMIQPVSSSTHLGGGAIFAHNDVVISGNSGSLRFSCNYGNTRSTPTQSTPAIEASESSANTESANTATSSTEADTSSTVSNNEAAQLMDLGIQGGGAIFAKKIVIQNNSGEVDFSENCMNIQEDYRQKSDIIGGGALLGTDEVHISNNANLVFSSNYMLGGSASGGAILSKIVDLSSNQGMCFMHNSSLSLGGAVCSLNALNVDNNKQDISFIANRTKIAGGALASAEGCVSLSANEGIIEFKNNGMLGSSDSENYSGGGAIFAKQRVDISKNSCSVSFLGNNAGNFGGAILTGCMESHQEDEKNVVTLSGNDSKVVIKENSGDVIFSGNSVLNHNSTNEFGGGAICTQDLVIQKNSGLVAFYNNYAPTGGAVRICEKGTVVLEASEGDILFQGNRNSSDLSDGLYFAGKESSLIDVSASKNHSVCFSDAIIFEDLTLRRTNSEHSDILKDPTLRLNSKSAEDSVEHTGIIRFSSATSKIPQVAVLESGTLALSGQAQLWLCGLKQGEGSKILLASGTVLGIFEPLKESENSNSEGLNSPSAKFPYSMDTTNENDQLNEEKLLMDVSSFDIDLASFVSEPGTTPLPPQIVIPKGTVIGSGALDLTLIDTAGIGYENHALLNKETDIALITFKTDLTESVDANHVLESLKVNVSVPEITESTYGHTGYWSDPQVVHGKLMINWKPTGYKLNPEKSGAIVLNTLWGQYEILRALKQQQMSHNITLQRMEMDYSTNIWGSAMGTFLNCATIAQIDGFNHRSGGYALGLDTQLIEDFLIGGSFAQFFGYTDSQSYASRSEQNGYLGSAYMSIFSGSWLFKGMFIYSDVHNHLTTTYSSDLGKSQGSWNSRGILADANVNYRYIINSRRLISSLVSAFVPFAGAEYSYIELPTFSEIGSEARTFAEGNLQNVSVPVGVSLEHNYSRGQRSEVNSLRVSYAFDVYRQQPHVLVNLPVASYSWEGVGSNLSRKSMKAQFNNDTEWNSYFSTFLGMSYEWREHVVAYGINGGARLIF